MDSKQKLILIIQQSSLDQNDKAFWNQILQNEKIKEEEVSAILEVAEKDQATLEFLTKNLKDKIEMLQKGDESLKQKIAEAEEKFLNQNS